jgi:16S rRNA (uracil1498-N3)-methyltransferase
MNCILLEPAETKADGTVVLADRRAEHIIKVLRAAPGAVLRMGLIEGPLGTGVIKSITGSAVELVCEFQSVPPVEPPALDVLLALPRPKVMKRFWAVLASFSVRKIGLINAEKVERPYFDSHVLDPAFIREHLLEGCEQAGVTHLPQVSVHRRFKPFVEDELAAWSPGTARLSAHPGATAHVRDVVAERRGVLLAIGPEGGWNPFELKLLADHGFAEVGLTGGALRSDVACIALMALVRDAQG